MLTITGVSSPKYANCYTITVTYVADNRNDEAVEEIIKPESGSTADGSATFHAYEMFYKLWGTGEAGIARFPDNNNYHLFDSLGLFRYGDYGLLAIRNVCFNYYDENGTKHNVVVQ